MANLISVFLVDESSDDVGACIVDEGLAGGLDQSIKEGAKLFFYEFGDVFAVVGDVVLDHSGQHGAEGALIVKTILVLDLPEVSVRALLLNAVQLGVYLLENIRPLRLQQQSHHFLHQSGAIL